MRGHLCGVHSFPGGAPSHPASPHLSPLTSHLSRLLAPRLSPLLPFWLKWLLIPTTFSPALREPNVVRKTAPRSNQPRPPRIIETPLSGGSLVRPGVRRATSGRGHTVLT